MGKISQKGFVSVLILVLLLVGAAVGVYLIGKKTNIFPKAFESISLAESLPTDFSYLSNLVLLGQKNITQTSRNKVSANKIYHASGVIVDSSSNPNKVYVVDTGNNRVLGFNGAGFCNANKSQSCTVDSDCPIGDSCLVDGTKGADIVFGQVNFDDAACNRDNNTGIYKKPGADTMCLLQFPNVTNVAESWRRTNIDVDNDGNLYVPDVINNRVLKFNSPFSLDKTAGKGDTVSDFVWGQPDFITNSVNGGPYDASPINPGPNNLWLNAGPPDHVSTRSVSVDPQGNVWVPDTFNNRILRYPPLSQTPDLVLGQSNFNIRGGSSVCSGDKTNLNNVCTPIIAKIRPDTGDLYVVDEYPSGFKGRILIYKAPFTNGMPASKVIEPQDAAIGTNTYNFTHATGLLFNPYKQGEYALGTFWVHDITSRTLLLDDDGNVIKVIGAVDKHAPTGDQAHGGCDDIYDPNDFHLWSPGGSIGVDSANNLYFADERFHRIARYALPYTPISNGTKLCLPKPNGGLFKGLNANIPSLEKFGESVGVAVYNNQLLYQDENRIKVWNNYSTLTSSTAPNFEITGNNMVGSRRELSSAIDDFGRIWMFNEHGQIRVDQLPYIGGDAPLANFVKLYWQDDLSELVYRSFSGIAFDKLNKKIYLVDGPNNRILRVSNYNDFKTGKLLVDMVIGQPSKTSTQCNHGSSTPLADGLCEPYHIKLDNFSNLYVIENNYECHGNDRITVFMADDLKNAVGMFPNISATKVFVGTLTSRGPCGGMIVDKPFSPVSIAFNSKNQMVIGNDGYYGDSATRHLRQLWFYNDPLNKQTPDGYINIPMGAPGEITFDSSDKLIVQDHTWSRIWLVDLNKYPNLVVGFNIAPSASPSPTPMVSPSPSPLPSPSSSWVTSPLPSVLPSVTPTPLPSSVYLPVTLTVSPTTIKAGGKVTASWTNIPNPNYKDWLGLYIKGASNSSYISRKATNCSAWSTKIVVSGSCGIIIPRTAIAGDYQIRLFSGVDSTLLGQSNYFKVTSR